jgi:hypothetical protein
MSADKLVLSGDYYIKTANSGTITLDTGALVGTVRITGNLDVQGNTTQIESINATIKDNTIILNQGEPHTGTISALGGTSGIKISRDPTDSDAYAVTLLWDNNQAWTAGGTNGNGLWTFYNESRYAGVEVGFLKINSALSQATDKNYILTDGLTNLTIGPETSDSYLARLQNTNDGNDIPNKAYVDWKFSQPSQVLTATQARSIVAGHSSVMINDHTDQSATATSYITTYLDDIDVFRVYPTSVGMPVINLNFTPSAISSLATNTDLTLSANGTGVIAVNNGISFIAPVAPNWNPPSPETGRTKVYSSSTTGAGSTGLLYNHSDGTNITYGELVSARKAILLGIIF